MFGPRPTLCGRWLDPHAAGNTLALPSVWDLFKPLAAGTGRFALIGHSDSQPSAIPVPLPISSDWLQALEEADAPGSIAFVDGYPFGTMLKKLHVNRAAGREHKLKNSSP